MAPYAIAHLKLSMLLEQSGYTFGSDQRLGIYLTNTLEEAAEEVGNAPRPVRLPRSQRRRRDQARTSDHGGPRQSARMPTSAHEPQPVDSRPAGGLQARA